MKVNFVKPQACPVCGYRMDAHSALTGNVAPRPKDFSLCLNCGRLLRFDPELKLRPCQEGEIEDLLPEERRLCERAQQLIRSGTVRTAMRSQQNN